MASKFVKVPYFSSLSFHVESPSNTWSNSFKRIPWLTHVNCEEEIPYKLILNNVFYNIFFPMIIVFYKQPIKDKSYVHSFTTFVFNYCFAFIIQIKVALIFFTTTEDFIFVNHLSFKKK